MPGNREVQLAPYATKALNEAQHQIDGLRKEIQEAERLDAAIPGFVVEFKLLTRRVSGE
jgi:hypothetical protein